MNGYLDPQNSFIGYYISDYNQVLASPVPMNQTIVFADLENGKLYVKKMMGITPMIQTFTISPDYKVADAKPAEDPMIMIIKKLESMEKEISALKEVRNESPSTDA